MTYWLAADHPSRWLQPQQPGPLPLIEAPPGPAPKEGREAREESSGTMNMFGGCQHELAVHPAAIFHSTSPLQADQPDPPIPMNPSDPFSLNKCLNDKHLEHKQTDKVSRAENKITKLILQFSKGGAYHCLQDSMKDSWRAEADQPSRLGFNHALSTS